MSKKIRKPQPQPPRYYWWDSDNCYGCKNRNNCNGCKRLKVYNAESKRRRRAAIT